MNEGISYPCQQCDYKATQQSDLNRHVKAIHDGVRNPCQQCEAFDLSTLNRHVKSKHEGVRYHCQLCDYKAS